MSPEDFDQDAFVARLTGLLNERQWSQKRLEREMGWASGYVSSLMSGRRGKRPSHSVMKLSAVLGVSPEWLLYGHGSRETEETSHVRAKAPDAFESAVAWLKPKGLSSAAVALTRSWAQVCPIPLADRTWVDILEQAESALKQGAA